MLHAGEMKMLAGRVRKQAANSAFLPAAALLTAVALCVTFTSLNTSIAVGSARHNVLASTFCVIACATYILFMIVSRAAAFVLSYMEYGYDEIDAGVFEDDASPLIVHIMSGKGSNGGSGRVGERRLAAAHREAFISSMYLGGSGAFLALPALCMWDTTATACFIGSLGTIGFIAEHGKVSEFRPNVDRAGATTALKYLRWAMHASLAFTLAVIIIQANIVVVRDIIVEAIDEPLAWPMIVLATASPVLLRMGCTRAESLQAVLMSPSQCLEAGLPVSTLLAILVLCMFSPIDQLVIHAELSAKLAIPMLIICPSCLAAIIGFIMRGFRHKHSSLTAIILTASCAIRQQAVERRLADVGDWVAVGAVVQCVFSMLGYAWYRQSVVALEPPLPHHHHHRPELAVEHYADDEGTENVDNDNVNNDNDEIEYPADDDSTTHTLTAP